MFIVIDGIDGSGKSTQIKLLQKRIKKECGITSKTIHFPQYGKKSAGLAEEYLNGKYGNAEDVSAYQAALFYALDRYDASFMMREWLSEDRVILSDRYTSSSMAHLGGKIYKKLAREKFLNWLCHLESQILKIPKPDLSIILDIEAKSAQILINQKNKKGLDRKYLKNKKNKDIHEASAAHLKNTAKIYREIGQKYQKFITINCMRDNGELKTILEIHEEIWGKLKKQKNGYFI